MKIGAYKGQNVFAVKREQYIELSEEKKNSGDVYMIIDKVGFPLFQKRVLIGWTYNDPRILAGIKPIAHCEALSDVDVLDIHSQKKISAFDVIREKREQTKNILKNRRMAET